MSTTLNAEKVLVEECAPNGAPIRLRTPDEAEEYLRKHLTPVRYGPNGQPIYAMKDLERLNVIFPEDND